MFRKLLVLSLILLSSCAVKTANKNRTYENIIASSSRIATQRPLWPQHIPQWVPNTYPLRTPEEVIPVWVAPYVNKDGDLVDAHYIYMVVRHPHWIYEERINAKPAQKK